MPSKIRWTLNPKKWFGTVSNSPHKHEKKNNNKNKQNPPSRIPPTITTTRVIPRLLTEKNQIKIVPISISNNVNKNNSTTLTPITQLQLPAFSVRRETTSTLLSSSTQFNRQNTFIPTHTEPSIRKNGRFTEELSINATRSNNQPIQTTVYETLKNENFTIKKIDKTLSNMSHYCLINYPKHSPNINKESSLRIRSSSSSSSSSIDNDNSSSSGIFTDEHQHTESKDAVSILEVLSVQSIADSQTSLNHLPTRPIIHHYRRPMSVFETIDDKPQQQRTSLIKSHRSHSAEGNLKNNQIISTTKSQQSSAAIIKKIEKRISTNRSPITTLEKPGFIRIANATYRLTADKLNHLSYPRKNSIDSFIPYPNNDDPLRSANDEECYATLPRTSSTEQLDNNIKNDLRIILDECIRPMVTSIEKNRLTKNSHQRQKRSNDNNDHIRLNIENITDKLLSSIDYSIYSRYQRCY